MTTQLDPFETRLLSELRQEVVASTASAPRRTRRSLAVAAGVAATALVGALLVPGLGSTPAYSVQEGNAGEIEVEIHRPEDAAGLERALAEHGITANVTYLPGRSTCADGRYQPVDRRVDLRLSIGQELVRVTLPPGSVGDGETFVMAWSVDALTSADLDEMPTEDRVTNLGGFASSVVADVTTGPIAACEVIPAVG
ncbi:hypothetical protein [Nocardioides zhouii]|uniref:Uncharacterized protein n=1 Tax=Nocardioides zhouii TaxID=1168729 RepID=A0A4Q2T330_9ACTN|nr:hypothetical protein [Nocardioides zhouii]RYC12902.1 hypothetical protein EUA94_06620 [Nocardioides zhouii]